VILLLDTSTKEAAIATIADDGRVTEFVLSRGLEVIPWLRRTVELNKVTKVAVVAGPGSFTGLRVGVAFGLGLAKGLGVPIVPLPTLDLQAARSDRPVTAVVEAGRGRYYFLVPGSRPALGEPAEIPCIHALVGRLSPEASSTLEQAGHVVQSKDGLGLHGEAAMRLLESANEVAYGSLKIEYMQSFSTRA
jgi:tRNA threonylcarbamoyl adenosine modification protein YeaZ